MCAYSELVITIGNCIYISLGLLKKDISKMLLHESPVLQNLGINLVLKIHQRIHKTIGEALKSSVLQAYLISSLSTHLPDIQILFNLRSRLANSITYYTFIRYLCTSYELLFDTLYIHTYADIQST
jgi:hypothetical protein